MNIEEIKKKLQILLEFPQLKKHREVYINPVLKEEKLPKTFYENEIDSASPLQGAYIWSFTWENSQLVFKGYIPTG